MKLQETLEEVQQIQAELVQSEKMALGKLVAAVAHEMNTPVGIVKLTARGRFHSPRLVVRV